jgi:hypothetical protein
MIRATTARHWRAALAALLVCALLVFTTIYRNSRGFSPATAARCHSLSTDHTSARTLFAGDFGPLAIVISTPQSPAPPSPIVIIPGTVRTAPERRLSLVASPYYRPPPIPLG